MRKVLLSLVFCILAVGAAMAQNANRTGFFIEAAVGGTTGTTPRTSYGFDNGNLTLYHAHGTSVNLTFGFRTRISRYAAYEVTAEAQSPVDAIKTQPVFKLMPLSFRFTTPEFWRNYSFYFNFRIGGAIGNKGDIIEDSSWYDNYVLTNYITLDKDFHKDVSFYNEVSGGVAYQIGFGLNITTRFYAGFSWDAQYMFNQYRKNEPENLHWGTAGLRLGYRF